MELINSQKVIQNQNKTADNLNISKEYGMFICKNLV